MGYSFKAGFIKKLKSIKKLLKNTLIDLKTIPYFIKSNMRYKVKGKKIRVVFMCQYIPAWNKFEPIYREMLQNGKFEPYLLCIPDCIQNNEVMNYTGINETYKYFEEHEYTNIIDAYKNEEWIDIKTLGVDYVFYTRPYNHMMPLQYTTSNVKKYCRIGSLNYGMEIIKEIFDVTLNSNFYKDVFVYYAETKIALKVYRKKFPITTRLRLRKVEFHGYPVFEQILKDKNKESSSWKFSNNAYRIMWTPRWTTARHLGGSNFFMYYKSLIEYAKKNVNMDFLVRPHPLTFGNFIKTGEMTEQEVEEYLKSIESMPNMSIDKQKEYNDTIWGSDALIADISAFIPEYYLTEKPVIFCASNMYLELTDEMEEMLKGCYISYSAEETYNYLDKLKNGEDPLKSIRKKNIEVLFGKSLENASSNIVESIYKLSK